MPRFDGTGSRGYGQGRGLGPCGNGQRQRRSRFLGCLNFFRRTQNNQSNVNNLAAYDSRDQIVFLEKELQDLEDKKHILIKKIEKLKGK